MKHFTPTLLFILFAYFGLRAQNNQSTQPDKRRYAENMLYVKFVDGSDVHAENGRLVTPIRLSPLLSTLGTWRAAHHLSPAKLDALRKNAERNLKKSLPDPNMNFYFVVNDPKDLAQAKTLMTAVPGTERVQYVPIPTNAATPDLVSFQSYPLNVTSGINAETVWSTFSNRGTGIKVCDIEYDFNHTHQDLPAVTILGPTPSDPFGGGGADHGTAVLGEIASLNNAYGTTGISPDCQLYFAGAYTSGIYDLAAAITNALSVLSAGDVILLEQQIDGPYYTGTPDQYGLVPVEWYELYYDAIVLAVGQDVTVVEAAGNGQQDLDDPIYEMDNDGHYPFVAMNNSGAIIVGAGAADTAYNGSDVARSRLWYSNYGSRIDVQGNGQAIFTTGYGDYYSAEGVDLWYTNDFGGTSGASPIVTGAVTLMQSVNKDLTGNTLTPAQVRAALIATGKPQQAGSFPLSQHIGPLPDIFLAIQYIITSGIDEQENNLGWNISPNPGNGLLQITQQNNVPATVMVYDVQGNLLKNETLSGSSLTLDLSAQANGIYLVQYRVDAVVQHKKVVIAR